MSVESSRPDPSGGPSLSGRPIGGLVPLPGLDEPRPADVAVGGPVRAWMRTVNPTIWTGTSPHDPNGQALQTPATSNYARWLPSTLTGVGGALDAVTTDTRPRWRVGTNTGSTIFAARLPFPSTLGLPWVLTGEAPTTAVLAARDVQVSGLAGNNRWAGLCVLLDGVVVAGADLSSVSGTATGDIVVDIKTLLSDWHRCVPMLVVRTGAGATGAQYADIGRLGLEITAA